MKMVPIYISWFVGITVLMNLHACESTRVPLTIDTSPGMKKSEEGLGAEFRWTLSKPFDTTYVGSSITIYKSVTSGTPVLLYKSGTGLGCNTYGDSSLSCITEGTQVGFGISDIETSDASRYSIQVDPGPGTNVEDSDAVLYIYQRPMKPVITGNSPVLPGNSLTLKCSANLLSSPPEFQDPDSLRYSWGGSATGATSTITLGSLDKTNNGDVVTCTAIDDGASESLRSEATNVTIMVYFSPKSVSITGNTAVAEDADDLTLTCSIPPGDEGNPDVYSYYWKNPSSTDWVETTRIHTVNRSTLSATLHEGTWQCQAGNTAGNTSSATVTVTVNAYPTILTDLGSIDIPVHETLTVTCSFTSKPVSTVTWTGPSGSPNDMVLDTTTTTQSNTPYTITTSRMIWKTGDYDLRKTVSGDYTCTANNGYHDVTSKTMNLIVQYAPTGVSLASSHTAPVLEGLDGLELTCTVGEEGNPPTDSYYWKYPRSSDWVKSTDNTRIISSSTLSVGLHDGTWTCQAANTIGNTTAATVEVTVHALPSVKQQPMNTNILVNQSLDLSCVISAKPEASVSWRYETTESPDTTILNSQTTTDSTGNYDVTTSTLTWKTYDDNMRKTISGDYTCTGTAKGGNGDVTSPKAALTIEYWPWTISLSIPEPVVDVIEKRDPVSITCLADCNPDCVYVWTDQSGSEVSSNVVLDLGTPDRTKAGIYKCTATNDYGHLNTDFELNVLYSPSIVVETSNLTAIVEGDSMTLTGLVDSNPISHISLYNVTDDQELKSQDGQDRLEYTFSTTHCLDTGEYRLSADNTIPDGSRTVKKTLFIDIKCPPTGRQFPPSGVEGVPLGTDYNISVIIQSNPFPDITHQSWSFIDFNGTLRNDLPDNVAILVESGLERLTILVKLLINDTQDDNYGNYTLSAGNQYGNMTPIVFSVLPRGPPRAASVPRQEDVTAVSLTISWTAGFDGGLDQTFTVVYRQEETTEEHKVKVTTDDVHTGDVFTQKLKDEDTIAPDTSYEVWIISDNEFEGNSVTAGNPTTLRTLVLATFTSVPNITILDGIAQIQFRISGQLTHIIEENCVTDTTICVSDNITVPDNTQDTGRRRRDAEKTQAPGSSIKLNSNIVIRNGRQTSSFSADTHTFTEVVPLADPNATAYVFSFLFYDGEDLLNATGHTSSVARPPDDVTPTVNPPPNTTLIIGAVVGTLLAAIISGTLVVLWRKGILPKPKSGRSSSERPMITRDTAHQGLDNPARFDNPYDIDPYGTSDDVRPGIMATASSGATGQVGPITGDMYSVVNKKNKPGVGAHGTAQPEGQEAMYSQVDKSKKTRPPAGGDGAIPGTSVTSVPMEEMYAKVDKTRKSSGASPPPPTNPPPAQATPTQSTPTQAPRAAKSKMDKMKALLKRTKKADTPNEQQYANVEMKSQPEVVYADVDQPIYANTDAIPKPKPAKSGVDVVYADLDIIGKKPESEEIRGVEKVSDYASIDYKKLMESWAKWKSSNK